MSNSMKLFIVAVMLVVAFAGLSRIPSKHAAKSGSRYVAAKSGGG